MKIVLVPEVPSSLTEWQQFTAAMQKAYFKKMPTAYYALALGGEVGELQNLLKKVWREELDERLPHVSEEQKTELRHELADVLVYLLCLANALDIDLEVAFASVYNNKILPRLQKGYYAHQKEEVE